MSIYIFMKLFESAPGTYDKGIQIITMGTVDKAYDRLISSIKKNDIVLDIGCGTGALSLRAAAKGAYVKGIDINRGMLDIAKNRAKKARLEHRAVFTEMGIAELDQEETDYYDVIISGLCFSELIKEERLFALKQVRRILKWGGFFLVADEVSPKVLVARFLFFFLRSILLIITWIITRTTTHPVKGLRSMIEKAGFSVISETRSALGSFIELKTQKAIKKS
jgi:ubiquinone/menaquinone biosynthesis C-methylase UbiE